MAKRNRTDYRKIKQLESSEKGVAGLPISNGKIKENTIRKFRGVDKIKLLEEMVNFDPTVGAFNNMYQSTASSVKWSIKPKDDSNEAKEIANFVSSCFFEDLGHPFQEVISNALTASQYGFAIMEPVFKMRYGKNNNKNKSSIFNDGLIGLSKIASRYQGSIIKWNYTDDFSKIESIRQKDPNNYTYIDIPYNKILHFKHRSLNDNPEGKSLYYNCIVPYLNKKDITVLESIRYEKGYSGLLVAKLPSVILDPNTKNPAYLSVQAWLKDTLQNLRDGTSTGVALPEYIDLTTIGDTEGTPDADKIIAREDRNIALSLLSDFFLATQKSGVSASFSQSKIKIFINLVKEMLDEIREVINFNLIPKLLEKNLMNEELVPTLEYSEIGDLDLTNLSLLLQSSEKSGLIVPTLSMTNTILKRYLGNDAPTITQEEFDNYQMRREINTFGYADPLVANTVVADIDKKDTVDQDLAEEANEDEDSQMKNTD